MPEPLVGCNGAGARLIQRLGMEASPTTLLRGDGESIYRLARRFVEMVQEGKAAELEQWLLDAQNSGVEELKNFAEGIVSQNLAAVRAALTEVWSNGQVEGQINRLKMLKRQSYGRADFELLRARVLRQTA
jgi:transposase